MKRMFLILVISAYGLVPILSQTEAAQTMSSINLNNAKAFDERYQGVRGSPFILEEWSGAILFPTGEPPLRVNYINFDRHTAQLCFRDTPDGQVKVINKYLIDSFMVIHPADTFRFIRFKTPGSGDYIFLESVYEGKGILYLDHAKEFVPADYEQVYSSDRRYDEFKDQPVYYIKLEENGELLEVKRNKKITASLFGPYSGEMLKYLKTEKISLVDRNHLVAMMQYYDRISE
jgi:hypothetical protein